MSKKKRVEAGFVIIGNEILSGRTVDKNLNFLAVELTKIGINLIEVRVVRDIEEEIIKAVNELRDKLDYVFTSGGIGPTHDDITALSISKAFGVALIRDPKAEAILRDHYDESNLNDARLKMADIPEGSMLLNNPVTSAPGFKKENVFVFAGVPSIMQAMFFAAKEYLTPGVKTLSRSISCYVTEGDIAEKLSEVQNEFQDLDIGSYPYIKNQRLGTAVVFRGEDEQQINAACDKICSFFEEKGVEIVEG
jgi:molybdenum cofactor synthesis domain-containing protein